MEANQTKTAREIVYQEATKAKEVATNVTRQLANTVTTGVRALWMRDNGKTAVIIGAIVCAALAIAILVSIVCRGRFHGIGKSGARTVLFVGQPSTGKTRTFLFFRNGCIAETVRSSEPNLAVICLTDNAGSEPSSPTSSKSLGKGARIQLIDVPSHLADTIHDCPDEKIRPLAEKADVILLFVRDFGISPTAKHIRAVFSLASGTGAKVIFVAQDESMARAIRGQKYSAGHMGVSADNGNEFEQPTVIVAHVSPEVPEDQFDASNIASVLRDVALF